MSEYITTYTGQHFEPTNPDPELIRIEDIAHALSMLCRGNGHVKTFWSVGQHCICCAREAAARGLSNRMVLACLLHDARQILERFEGTDVPIFTAEFEVLTKMTGFKLTRGMLCALKRQPLMDYQNMCEGKDRIVILENVMNPTNVGAIFRSAAALNMDAVFLTPGCSDPLYRRASRVSMGTVFQIPWTFIQDNNEMRCQRKILWPRQAITELREMGYKTAALALTDDSVGIDNPELMQEEKLAIILGTEGEGLMDRTIEMCDYTVKIPMSHDVDSLNVAAASAVAFWQLGKKQK